MNLQKKNVIETQFEILLAFSLSTNIKKIMKTTRHEGQISNFDGLKVISMFWVIMGHRYVAFEENVINLEYGKKVISSLKFSFY